MLAQTFLALFDLIGIGLLGLVVALGASGMSGNTPKLITGLLEFLGLNQVERSELLFGLSIAAGVMLVAKTVISFIIIRRTYRFLAVRQAIVSGNLIEDLLSRPILFIQETTTQDITVALTSGAYAATLGVIGSAVVLFSEIPVLVVLGIGLSFLDLGVTVFTILFFGLTGLLIHRLIASRGRKLGSQISDIEIASHEAVQDAISSFKEISVFGRQHFYVDLIKSLRTNAAKAQGTSAVINQSTKYIYEIMLIFGAGLLLIVQLLTKDMVAALTIITVFLAAASRLIPSLLRLQTAAFSITWYSGAAEPTLALHNSLKQTPSGFKSYEISQAENFTGHLEIRNVEFSYPGATSPAISNFSLELQPGQSLALVGPTGAGKSTISDLILGLMNPKSGEVLISSKSPAEIIQTHPGAISYVPQATSIVRGNIRDNVALGINPEYVDDHRIWEALERAQLADFLKSSRSGLDTLVGEKGVQLSGGQRQRLGLARALYSRPKLLVLDEATSALDSETEAAVTKALSALEGEVTTITIAHRLATIRHCDVIVYLEQGREVARGSFNEVRELSPAFNQQAILSGL